MTNNRRSATSRIRNLVALPVMLLLFLLGTNTAFAVSLPGLNPSGFGFTNDLSITWRKRGKNYVNEGLARRSTGTLDLTPAGGGLHPIDKMTFKLKATHSIANFGTPTGLLSGSLTIKGTIASLGLSNATLFTADLTKFGFTDGSNSLFGYNTSITYCNPAFVAYCTNNESVYMAVSNGSIWDSTLFVNYTSDGIAITTVPVPAAVWLFGSGLLGLVGIARRKKAIA